MLESGLIKKWKSSLWPEKDKCSTQASGFSGNRIVSIGDMQGTMKEFISIH